MESVRVERVDPWATWQYRNARTRDQRSELCHDGMAQRGLVGWSQAALERAEARVNQACPRAAGTITQHRWHLQAKRVETPPQAHEAVSGVAPQWR